MTVKHENGDAILEIKVCVCKTWELDYMNALAQVVRHFENDLSADQVTGGLDGVRAMMLREYANKNLGKRNG